MTERKPPKAWAFDQPFAKVFPEVKDVVVEYEVSSRDLAGADTSHGQSTMSVLGGTFQGRIPCRHPECHGGGFEIERVVDGMVQEREESREGVLVCPGWIGDRDRAPCVNSLRYSVVLLYKLRTTPKAPVD
jgi:hypothetical protein